MKFLLTNDDGIDAPGLAALAQALAPLGELVTVAPHQHLSGCSHQATTHRDLQLVQLDDHSYQLDGTPVDCTRVALAHLARDVDWVISGINAGGNLGHDVFLSGTVAAAREAALLGKPAIALSQYVAHLPIQWTIASQWATAVVRRLLDTPRAPGVFWNVNFPDLAGLTELPSARDCPLDPHPLPMHYEVEQGRYRYRGRYQDRQRHAGSDVDACFGGHIAVTQLRVPTRDR